MRTSVRGAKRAASLNVEILEDRLTPVLAYGLTAVGSLISFDTTTPTTGTDFGTPTGVVVGDTLVAIDVRPATGQLYALGVNAAGAGTLYTLTPLTPGVSTATVVGTADSIMPTAAFPNPALATSGFGFDFNPTVDRIRIVTTAGQSIVLNPDTAVIQTNAPTLNGGAATADASAYTNNVPGATVTTLYSIDAASDKLYIQVPASSLLTAQGAGLGVNIDVVNGFDIPAGVNVATSGVAAVGAGFLAATVAGNSGLYSVDLTTGVATLLGNIGTGSVPLRGLAVTTGGTVSFQNPTQTVAEAAGSVNVVLTRTGGTGPQTVTVNVTGGTATVGADFAAGPYTVTFANGATTTILNIPIANDTAQESTETLTLSIASVTNGSLGTQTTTTISITDDDSPLNFLIGTGAGVPVVQGFNADGTQRTSFMPYGPNATGGVRVAMGDITGDGVADIITVPGTGPAIVMAFDGVTGASLGSFLALVGNNGGASLAVGDLNGDGLADIIVGATTGLAVIEAYSGANLSSLGNFLPFGSFFGGVNVAAGDLNGDGLADVVAGQARFGTLVAGFSGKDLSSLGTFFAFPGLTSGITLALADLNNDGLLDIIVGTASGPAFVGAFSGANLSSLGSFQVFNGAAVGVNVTAPDLNGDGRPDILVGSASGIAQLSGYDGTNLFFFGTLLPFGAINGGIYVA